MRVGESEMRMEMAGTQKPMVTAEQYEQARAVLDALPPGIYLHCSGCKRWTINGAITMEGDYGSTQYLCEGCA